MCVDYFTSMQLKNNKILIASGRYGSAVASTVTSQQEGSWFKPTSQLGPFCVEFACSPLPAWGFFSRYSGFHPHSKDMQVRLIGVSVSGCLSLYVGPVTDGWINSLNECFQSL